MDVQKEKPTLSAHAVRRLTLSRYYLSLGSEHARQDRENDSFVAINLLHEAVETFLIAASEHLNASTKARTDFSTYLDKIDEVIAPQRLPFRNMLIRFNKARVNAKHDSIAPDRADIPVFAASVAGFLDEASEIVFGLAFSSISMVDLIREGKVKDHLNSAQAALEERRFVDVLVECRKALYLTFEEPFDVSAFANDQPGFAGFMCQAPFYARSKKYIDDNVKEPFDFIVLDHTKVDSDLVKDGLDPVIFWNVWRLTPDVYQSSSKEWYIKHDLRKIDKDTANENASYVLDNTISLIHQRERKRLSMKSAGSGKQWSIVIKNKNANVYKKASKNSEIVGHIPDEIKEIDVQIATPSLDGPEYYWKVFIPVKPEEMKWLSGYVDEADLSFD